MSAACLGLRRRGTRARHGSEPVDIGNVGERSHRSLADAQDSSVPITMLETPATLRDFRERLLTSSYRHSTFLTSTRQVSRVLLRQAAVAVASTWPTRRRSVPPPAGDVLCDMRNAVIPLQLRQHSSVPRLRMISRSSHRMNHQSIQSNNQPFNESVNTAACWRNPQRGVSYLKDLSNLNKQHPSSRCPSKFAEGVPR